MLRGAIPLHADGQIFKTVVERRAIAKGTKDDAEAKRLTMALKIMAN